MNGGAKSARFTKAAINCVVYQPGTMVVTKRVLLTPVFGIYTTNTGITTSQ